MEQQKATRINFTATEVAACELSTQITASKVPLMSVLGPKKLKWGSVSGTATRLPS
jgi:hypothetical protein